MWPTSKAKCLPNPQQQQHGPPLPTFFNLDRNLSPAWAPGPFNWCNGWDGVACGPETARKLVCTANNLVAASQGICTEWEVVLTLSDNVIASLVPQRFKNPMHFWLISYHIIYFQNKSFVNEKKEQGNQWRHFSVWVRLHLILALPKMVEIGWKMWLVQTSPLPPISPLMRIFFTATYKEPATWHVA